jgi:5'-AMP-activated protein kinase regulatory gamma subunit
MDQMFNIDLDAERDRKHSFSRPLPVQARSRAEEKDRIRLRDDSLLSAQRVADFLGSFNCFDLMPQSSKVVVLDTKVTIGVAVRALEENDLHSAPLWDSKEKDFVGFLSLLDLVNFLVHFYHESNSKIKETMDGHVDPLLQNYNNLGQSIEKQKISWCREAIPVFSKPTEFINIEPSDTLLEAVQLFVKYKIHRLPVIDREEQNSILYILTPMRILVFLLKVMTTRMHIFSQSIEELSVGSFDSVAALGLNHTLIQVLDLMIKKSISIVPIVDETGVVVDVFYKSDIIYIANTKQFDYLDKPIKETLALKNVDKDRKVTCLLSDTLEMVSNRMLENRLQSLVCVDADNRPVGVITMGDMMRFFLS